MTTLEASRAGASLLTGRLAPFMLVLFTVVLYLPSLEGGFLNLDDPWLVVDNPIVRRGASALATIWTDLSREARLSLGAEYLPVRDTTVWLEHRVHGLSPTGLRITNLAGYCGGVLLIRSALKRACAGGVAPEVAAWLFATHPLHVESVAWIASRKDVLALLFAGAALYVHSGDSRRRDGLVPLFAALAVLSKTLGVAVIGLMLSLDLLAGRRPERRVYLPTAVVLGTAIALQAHVGRNVGMMSEPVGESRVLAVAAMGRALWGYLMSVFAPSTLSLPNDPPTAEPWDLLSTAGWGVIALWCGLGIVLARERSQKNPRGRPLVLAAFVWFAASLAPVSQIAVPLQNFTADRYMLLALMGPALIVAGVAERMGDRRALGATVVLAGGLGLYTWQRAGLFADSERLFLDSTTKTERAPLAPYQLAQAYEDRGEDEKAIFQYREVIKRAPGKDEAARRATNNLAKLHFRHGDLTRAERVLRRGTTLWPDDPKIRSNLEQVLSAGERARAQ